MELQAIPLILPAAGRSSRLGEPKGLKIFRERPWLEWQCEAFRSAGGKQVLLVLGPDRDAYFSLLHLHHESPHFSHSFAGCDLQILFNSLPQFGPFSSLQIAARWIEASSDCAAAFYQPIDTPVPERKSLEALVNALDSDLKAVVPMHGERGGHPVLISRSGMKELSELDPEHSESRLDIQIKWFAGQSLTKSVEVDDARVLLNLNTPEDWSDFEQQFETS